MLRYCKGLAESMEDEDGGERDRGEEVDERTDPYSGRIGLGEGAKERLRRVVKAEEGVERIVRARSWEVVSRRCEGMGEM